MTFCIRRKKRVSCWMTSKTTGWHPVFLSCTQCDLNSNVVTRSNGVVETMRILVAAARA